MGVPSQVPVKKSSRRFRGGVVRGMRKRSRICGRKRISEGEVSWEGTLVEEAGGEVRVGGCDVGENGHHGAKSWMSVMWVR
jgi:hypothetical protein